MKDHSQRPHEVRISGVPNEKQREFFASRTRFTAYGGARGGGKSWALRRKLVAMCLRYPGIRALIVRRSYDELKANHVMPFMRESAERKVMITAADEESPPIGSSPSTTAQSPVRKG